MTLIIIDGHECWIDIKKQCDKWPETELQRIKDNKIIIIPNKDK